MGAGFADVHSAQRLTAWQVTPRRFAEPGGVSTSLRCIAAIYLLILEQLPGTKTAYAMDANDLIVLIEVYSAKNALEQGKIKARPYGNIRVRWAFEATPTCL